MNVVPNFETKESLIQAVEARQLVMLWEPGNLSGEVRPVNGSIVVEGPHSPPVWTAQVTVAEGAVVKVK